MEKFDKKIPDYIPEFSEFSKQLKINCEFIKKEITDHINDEIKRFHDEINKIKNKENLQ